MLVYGPNVLKELDKKRIKKVYSSRKEILSFCKNENISYEFMDVTKLNHLVSANHQGVVVEIYDYAYYDFNAVEGDFVLVLDHLEDPHNFGAIIRSAVGAGIKTIIIPKDRSVKVTDTVVKTSVGMINHVKIVMVNNIVQALKKLQDMGYFVYTADMYGQDYKMVDYSDKKVLVIGNEGNGVARLVKETSDVLVKIPIDDVCESLNASVAAGILIFEMRGKNG
ncbi:MAG: 23S rRNA (guanosine(2251)-2'-O)-methyltransferase RlmB [Bacilli bacterium]|nr:23S rRNA (guanosine(2251)-2'-O)-methyltransferase RlmB [Bacilli bacterium]